MIREDVQTAPKPMSPPEAAPVTLTTEAAGKLREVMTSKGLAQAGLRVFVSGGGCSGLQYGMAFETEGEADDHVFESEGVRVFVDPVSITYLQGSSVDFEESLMGGGFKIENPNAAQSCGCGHSFKSANGGQQGAGEQTGGQQAGGHAAGGGCGSGGCGCG